MENVLITGISGGIGRAVAEELLEGGSSVLGISRETDAVRKELEERYGERIHTVSCDLAQTESFDRLFQELVERYGPLGGFVHCAGHDKMAPLHLVKARDLEELWRIHALVPIRLISLLSRKRNYQENTAIVLISSQSAHEGAMGHTAYAAAKGAIEGFLAPAAAELMEKGIRINEVCFAPVRTKMSARWMERLTPEALQELEASYPLGLGEVSDAARLICFLLSEKSRFINGQIIVADGGHAVRKV